MFQIKSYLQYKNTPDGKPRVLVEGVDYWQKNETALTENYDYVVAELEDCRSLCDFKGWTETFTELDIYKDGDKYYMLYMGFGNMDANYNDLFAVGVRGVYGLQVLNGTNFLELVINETQKIGSFFDNPAKYSKLLWDCSEEEGWEKVFKLLRI